jgi:membrane-associated phospholipid phosphatase
MKLPLYNTASILFMRLTAAIILSLLLVVCFYPKSTSFIAANEYHTEWMDSLFSVVTNLGDGLFALLLCICFFIFKRRGIALRLLITFILSGVVVQIVKHAVSAPRPKSYFAPEVYSHFIIGITNSGLNSFPSGHSATAFAVASILAMNIPCKKWCSIFFTLAIAVVYSRVYLGQHFIEDALMGIIIGVASSLFTESLCRRQYKIRQLNFIKSN